MRQLSDLATKWDGELIRLKPDEMLRLRLHRKDERMDAFSAAPFSRSLAVAWNEGRVFYTRHAKIPDILHEMGHVFATQRNPRYSAENEFFVWERALAKLIGYPMSAWARGNKDYIISTASGHCDFGKLSRKERDLAIELRWEEALINGCIAEDGTPLCVRDMGSTHEERIRRDGPGILRNESGLAK